MNNTISKDQLIDYIKYRIDNFQHTIELKCFWVLGMDARELIGTVRTAYMLKVFTEKEKEEYIEKIYQYIYIAESNEHRDF